MAEDDLRIAIPVLRSLVPRLVARVSGAGPVMLIMYDTRLKGALNPADVGRAVTRRFRFDGRELIVEFDTRGADGLLVTRVLRWRRVG